MRDSLPMPNHWDTLSRRSGAPIDIADEGDARGSGVHGVGALPFDTAFPLVILLSLTAWVLVLTVVLWLSL